MKNYFEIASLIAIGEDLLRHLKPGTLVTLKGEPFSGMLAKVVFAGHRDYFGASVPVIELDPIGEDWFGRLYLTHHGEYGTTRFDRMPVLLVK